MLEAPSREGGTAGLEAMQQPALFAAIILQQNHAAPEISGAPTGLMRFHGAGA